MPTPVFLGKEHILNLMQGEISQSDLLGLTALASGGLLTSVAAQNGYKVYTHNPDGSLKAESFLSAPGARPSKSNYKVSALSDGRFVASWDELGRDPVTKTWKDSIQARLYDADGTSASAPFRIDDGSLSEESIVTVTSLAGGNIAVTYANAFTPDLPTGSSPGFFVRFFNPAGVPLGASTIGHTVTADSQDATSAAGLSSGNLVVVYDDQSASADHVNSTVRGTIITATGSKTGFLAQSSAGSAHEGRVAGLADGRFVLTWTSTSSAADQGGDGSGYGIVARIFNANGTAATNEIKVNTSTTDDQYDSSVTAMQNGGFAIAFTDLGEPDDPTSRFDIGDIKVQLFDRNGAKDGAEIRVNTTARGDQYDPQIVELADGRLAVSWSDQDETTVLNTRVQYLDPRSAPVTLKGTALKDEYVGTAFKDTIGGGAGDDWLAGGAGKDAFVFSAALTKGRLTNVDKISDFNVKDDSVWLENAVFKAIGKGTAAKPGKLDSDMFTTGTKARDAEDRIIYDKKTGALWYDADGTGARKAVQIAELTKNLKLTHADFFVI